MSSREFLENIESEDLMIVRSVLLDDLIIDRTFKTFDEDYKTASQKMELLEPFDGKEFETDFEKWDKQYLNQQKVALMLNFSKERIEHLKDVIIKVIPSNVSDENTVVMSSQSSYESRTNRSVINKIVMNKDSVSRNKPENQRGGTALIIGGVTATAIGIAIAKPVIIGAGVVVLGTGICIKIINRR